MPPKPLTDIWKAGVNAVRGDAAVTAALPHLNNPPTRILAVGKAACDMARPVMHAFPGLPVTIATKHNHISHLPGPAQIVEAGHPIPDKASLSAGQILLDAVTSCEPKDHLLMLVSGGASAIAEALPPEMTLQDWAQETASLVASGADIHAINTRRKEVSRIKGGKLLRQFRGKAVTSFAISDVEGDALDVIGSGIGAAPPSPRFSFTSRIVASNAIARQAASDAAQETVIRNTEALYGDITKLAPRIADQILNGPAGLSILGGEPTIALPKNPGRGGRNQALALALAQHIAGFPDIEILVAGTDGTDGPTQDAGALVNGDTWGPGANVALTNADTGTYLAKRNALFTTGPTGTNVMDLLIARKT